MRTKFLLIITLFCAYSVHCQNFVGATKSNDGQALNLANDKVLEIKLPSNPSTGYGWYPSKINTSVVKQIGNWEFVLDMNNINNIVGQSGTEAIRFIGASQGTTELTLEYKRPWEENEPSIDSFKLTINSNGKYTGNYTISTKTQSFQQAKNLSEPLQGSPSLPSSFSWQSQCTPIANQEHCGDCWAFAGVGTFECNILIMDGATRDISEEYLTNCYTGSYNGNSIYSCNGCNGGWCPHAAWLPHFTNGDRTIWTGGAVYESEAPWTTTEGSGFTEVCGGPYVVHETIDSYADVPGGDGLNNIIPPVTNIKAAIYNYGPVWVAIDAGNNFQNYHYPNLGVFTNSDGTSLNHAVVLVGWKDSTFTSSNGNYTGYWILRNSWSEGWGEHGYMRIGYGVSAVGMYADYIVYKGGIPCRGTPDPGNTLSSTNSVCPDYPFTLSLQNAIYPVGGLTYQWQSYDGSTWSDITGATNSTFFTTQTATTSYECVVTCSGNSATSTSVQVTMNAPASCFCLGTYTNCGIVYASDIRNVTFGDINNTTTNYCDPTYHYNYTDYTSTQSTTVIQGLSYPISVSTDYDFNPIYWGIWVDWNGSFTDNINEYIKINNSNGSGGYNLNGTGIINVPTGATVGNHRMRIRANYNSNPLQANVCANLLYGEQEDYTVNVIAPCTVAPASLNTISSVDHPCFLNEPFTLSLENINTLLGSGVSYQWQSSSDGSTWIDITGAINTTYVTSYTSDTYYRCKESCSNSIASMSSQIYITKPTICPCLGEYADCGNRWGIDITNVIFGTINNTTPANCNSPNNYSDYTNLSTTVWQGGTYTISVSTDYIGNLIYWGVWVDWYDSGLFDDTKDFISMYPNISSSTGTRTILVPVDAAPGNHRMRIRANSSQLQINDACSNLGYGEQEDYTVNVNLCPLTSTITPQGPTTFCEGNSVILNANTGTGLTYQWFSDGTSISNANQSSYTASANGNYTVIVSNSYCGITSSAVSVTVNSLPTASIVVPPSGIGLQIYCESVELDADTETGLTYQWQIDWSDIGNATESSYIALTSGSYTVIVSDNNNCSATSDWTTVTVNPRPTITSTSSATRCGTGTVDLEAIASAGTINWYDVETGGSSIGTGTPWTTPSLSSTTTYYVDATVETYCISYSRTPVIATVNTCSVSGTITYDNTLSTPLIAEEVGLYLANSTTATTTTYTDNNGNYTFSNISNGIYTIKSKNYKCNWGGCNPVDGLLVNRYYLNIPSAKNIINSPLRKLAADVNNSRTINPLDATLINRRYVGFLKYFFDTSKQPGDDKYKLPKWISEEPSITVNGADVSQNIKAICTGDVNGSNGDGKNTIVCGDNIQPNFANRNNDVPDYPNDETTYDCTVTINSIVSKPGDNVSFHLDVNDFNNIGSFGFRIQYDTSVLTLIGIKNINNFIKYNIDTNRTHDTLNFAWFTIDNNGRNIGNSSLFDMKFIYNGGTTSLSFLDDNVVSDNAYNEFSVLYVNGNICPLYITEQPQNIEKYINDAGEFSLTASGTPPLSYQWYKLEAGNWTLEAGATTSNYQLSAISETDAGSYLCVINNECGSVSSDIASLSIISKKCAGDNVTFSLTATGIVPMSYQWYKNNLTPISGANSTLFAIDYLTLEDAGKYYCVITNGCGNTTSNKNILEINTPPEITLQPEDDILCTGIEKIFIIEATGTEPLSYQWYKLEAGNWTLETGQTSTNYELSTTSSADAGSYTCVIENVCGSVTSDDAVLTINSPPEITQQPEGMEKCEGTNAIFTITAMGTEPLSYQWYKLEAGNWTLETGATTTNYELSTTNSSDAGSYNCVIENECGSITSDEAVLTINPLPDADAGSNSTICSGSSAYIGVSAVNGNTYGWTSDPAGFTSFIANPEVSPTITTTYTLTETITATGCQKNNPVIITVNIPANITVSPSNSTIDPGDNTDFSVTATGTGLSYQWQVSYHGSAAYTNITTAGSGPVYSGYTGSELSLSDIIYNNSTNEYRCIVTASSPCGGSVTSDAATLTVTPSAYSGIWTGETSADWNTGSNWEDGFVPGSTIDVIINSSAPYQPLIQTDNTGLCNDATIGPAASLSVEGTFIAGGDLLIESSSSGTGAFTQTDDASVTISGNATMQTYIQDIGYHYISSPLTGATCNGISGFNLSSDNTGFYYNPDSPPSFNHLPNLWEIDENHTHDVSSDGNAWYASEGNDVMTNMKGYIIRIPSQNTTISITKPGSDLNAGDFSIAVSKETSSTDTDHNNTYLNDYGQTDQNGTYCGTGPTNGWHIVGNPYPSPVDWNAVVDSGGVGENICYGITFFKPTSQYAGIMGTYYHYGTETYTAGAFAPGRYIPAMQSFYIQNTIVSAPYLTFKNAYRNVSPGYNFYFNAVQNVNQPPLIALYGNKNTCDTIADKALILFNSDTLKIMSSKYMNTDTAVPNLYVIRGQEKLSIKSYSQLLNNLIIPLGFRVNSNGEYTINAGEIDNFPDGLHIFLEDTKNSYLQDMTIDPYYTFSFDSADAENRFFLKFVTIQITSQPQSLIKCINDTAVFNVTADGIAPISYQWMKLEAGNWTLEDGATTTNYELTTTNSSDAGAYACVVSNEYGSVTSDEATLTINTPPVITLQLVNITKCEGESGLFTITVSGTEPLSYQWVKTINNEQLTINNATNSQFSILNSQLADAGTYRCIVNGICPPAVTSNAVSLTVNSPAVITSQPVNTVKCRGQLVSFSVTASGSGLSYHWQENGINLNNGGYYSGVTTSAMYISYLTTQDGNQYRCIITSPNTCTKTSSAAILTINILPAITAQPVSITKCPGETASFSVAATGTALSYQWQVNGINITAGGIYSLPAPNSLLISDVTGLNQKQYRCAVIGACSPSVLSSNAILTVNTAPVIIYQPLNAQKCAGSSSTFIISATGSPLTYQWYKLEAGSWSLEAGATTTNYELTNLNSSDAGTYRCIVNWSPCSPAATSNSATLTVNNLPVVNLGIDDTINTNQSKTLNAGAGYSTYLWNTGKTTRTITVLGSALNPGTYTYSVTVTNSNSCKGSDNINITVVPGGSRIIADNDKKENFYFTAYPNPFKQETTIAYRLPEACQVDIEVYDLFGKLVAILVNEQKNKGDNSVIFDAANLSGGIYHYNIIAGSNRGVGKIIIIR